jgi:predicted O-methyltransferase YrrM
MVDSWEGNGTAYRATCGDWHADLSSEAQNRYHDNAVHNVKFAKDRAYVHRMRSTDAAKLDGHVAYDFVFIDADHSYEGCKADIEAWWPLVKKGGWICGHDYANPGFPEFGVKQAVDEFVKRNKLDLELGDNFTWFVRNSRAVLRIVA